MIAVDRVKRDPEYIPNPSLTAILTVQPSVLDTIMADEQQPDGWIITGLTEEAQGLTAITIPAMVEDRPVIAFTADTFDGNTAIETISLPQSIRVLYDNSFDGCTHLRAILLSHTSPNTIGVGTALLANAPVCKVYVPEPALGYFSTHYSWALYADHLAAFTPAK